MKAVDEEKLHDLLRLVATTPFTKPVHKIMKPVDEVNPRDLLIWLGATLLFTEPDDDKIEIPRSAAAEIVAILSSLPPGKVSRPKLRSLETEMHAIFSLLNGTKVNALAREIAKDTGQPKSSARRRLQQLKNSSQFKAWRP